MSRVTTFLAIVSLAGAAWGPVNLAERALAESTCRVSWSNPIWDTNAQHYYVVVDNECPFAVQVTCRNNGIDHGKYCPSGQRGSTLYIGRTLGQDYQVSAKRAPG